METRLLIRIMAIGNILQLMMLYLYFDKIADRMELLSDLADVVALFLAVASGFSYVFVIANHFGELDE